MVEHERLDAAIEGDSASSGKVGYVEISVATRPTTACQDWAAARQKEIAPVPTVD